MNNWNVDDGHGNNVAQGLTEMRARMLAQEIADKTALTCLIYNDDGRSEEIEADQ